MKRPPWISIAGILAALGVAWGAFGAHALKSRLDERALEIYQTGVHYHLIHALALLGFGLWSKHFPKHSQLPGWFFSFGIILFSGSLYALAITGIKLLGAITPLGGVAFILGWIWWVSSMKLKH